MKHSTIRRMITLLCATIAATLSGSRPAALAQVVSTSDPVPAAGEIRLEGSIQSIAPTLASFVLNATSFTLPNGKSTALNPAKPKVVLIDHNTLLLVRGGGRKVTPGELKPGTFALVVGRDMGSGKELPARQIDVWDRVDRAKLLFGPVEPSPVVAPPGVTPPVAPPGASPGIALPSPFAPDSMTPPDGVTVNVVGAAFRRQELAINMQSRATSPDAWVFAPDGSIVEPKWGRFSGLFGSLGFSTVDPRWPYVTLVYQTMHPDTPPQSTGRYKEDFLLKNVAVPRKVGEVVALNQSVTTTHGTKVSLVRISRRKGPDRRVYVPKEYLLIEGRVDIASQSPVAAADVEWRGVADTGGDWKDDRGQTNAGSPELLVFPPPPDSVKALNVTISVKEEAPHLRDPRWQRRFQFTVKLPPVTPEVMEANRIEYGPSARAPVSNDLVSGILEDNGMDWDYGLAAVRLWLQDKSQPADLHRFWFVKDLVASDAQTHKKFRPANF
ncbi:MAG TPA: hypothetical protein VNA16_03990, partial [Abditibacteriaceae bacterium]|nr:hypothetical protein [Abditibacteriaceae bacterium]